jgi:UDP-4-amino-4,6-dideoxy-N-acetyl-beta-L-altrosamine transaminase
MYLISHCSGIPYIPYGKQFIDEDDIQAVIEVLRSDFITQGPKIKEFEKKLAQKVGAKFAVVFNSGTSALHAAYYVAGLREGDEFLTSPITFCATANAGIFLGAKPIFVDVEAETGNINPELIRKNITKNTKLIVPVHYAGHPCNLEEIWKIAKENGLVIIEDACHALGAKYKGYSIGSCKYSDMTVFSFHPVKHITTGEGGTVLTNNEKFYEKLLMFREHGITKDRRRFLNKNEGDWYYEMQFLGFNYRMTDIQAALGISQLKKLDSFIRKRREIAKHYNEIFKGNTFFDLPVEKEYAFHAYHLYPIRIKNELTRLKKEIFRELRSMGLGVQVHYIPVYLHPFYRNLGYTPDHCPVANEFYKRELSLPIFPSLKIEELEKIKDKLFEAFHNLLSTP